MLKQCCTLAMLAAVAMGASQAGADELQTTSQKLMEKYNLALVRVHATSQFQKQASGISFGQEDQTSISQGIVIDDKGTTIVSRSSFDPSVIANMIMASISINLGGEELTQEAKNKFKKIEMELADGTRVPARVLIVDPKYDIVVVAPKKPLDADKFTFLPIDSANAPEPSVLDDLIILRRLTPLLNSQVAVGLTSISSVTEKPFPMYYASGFSPSLPAFDTKGELVGITILKIPTNNALASANAAQYGVISCKYVRMVLEQARKNLD